MHRAYFDEMRYMLAHPDGGAEQARKWFNTGLH